MQLPRILHVTWTDHDQKGEHPWISREDAIELAQEPISVCHTVGFFLWEDDDVLCVVNSISGDDVGTRVERILKANITAKRAIGELMEWQSLD